MINAILRLSVERRFLTLSLFWCWSAGVEFSAPAHRRGAGYHQCPGTDQHRAPGYSLEEQRITFPVETALYGLPNLSIPGPVRYGCPGHGVPRKARTSISPAT